MRERSCERVGERQKDHETESKRARRKRETERGEREGEKQRQESARGSEMINHETEGKRS